MKRPAFPWDAEWDWKALSGLRESETAETQTQRRGKRCVARREP